MTLSVFAATLMSTLACHKDNSKTAFESNSARPDVLPTMLNKDLPFRYPPALYAEKAQGNVTLRLFVDTNGTVVNDSTRIVESSNVPLLDSAAMRGSRDLRFVPAKLRGAPMAVSLLFPVYFRHPEAPPPAGDTILNKVPVGQNGKADSTANAAAVTSKSSAKKKSSH
jgi:TonB family protein